MKKISLLLPLTFLLLLSFVTYVFVSERHYSDKYRATKLNISTKVLKEEWGEPDEYFVYGGRRFLKYNKGIIGLGYIFTVDNNLITEKYLDD